MSKPSSPRVSKPLLLSQAKALNPLLQWRRRPAHHYEQQTGGSTMFQCAFRTVARPIRQRMLRKHGRYTSHGLKIKRTTRLLVKNATDLPQSDSGLQPSDVEHFFDDSDPFALFDDRVLQPAFDASDVEHFFDEFLGLEGGIFSQFANDHNWRKRQSISLLGKLKSLKRLGWTGSACALTQVRGREWCGERCK